jgi:LysR family hydrogen peroxide-inducible transcriptional activator
VPAAALPAAVTQPTLSVQLRKLERALGAPLFDRGRTPVVPTDAGRRLLAQARAVLREAEALAAAADASADALVGEVRLGVIPTLAPYLLPPGVPHLRRRHPGLALVVEERLTDDVLDGVRRGALDGGLVATDVHDPALSARVLFTEPFVGYVGAGHRLAGRAALAPGDLAVDDVWLLGEGHCLRAQAVRLCRRRAGRARGRDGGGAAGGVRFESGNLETLERLVEQGGGMTLLPALAAAALRTDAQRALVRPFAAPAPARDVRLVQHRERARRERLVTATLDALLGPVPALLAAGRGSGPAAHD